MEGIGKHSWLAGTVGQLPSLNGPSSSYGTAGLLAVLLLSFLAIVLGWVWSSSGRKEDERNYHVPPGDLGLPFFGDTIQYVNAYYNRTIRDYVDMKIAKYGSPVFKAKLMGHTTVFMDAPNGTKLMFNKGNDEKLIQGYWPGSTLKLVGPNVLSAENGAVYRCHKQHLMSHFLGHNVVNRYLGKIETRAIEHIQNHWLDGTIDGSVLEAQNVLRIFTFELVADLCLTLTDKHESEKLRPTFEIWAKGLMALPINLPGSGYYQAMKARAEILSFFEPYVQRRKQELKDGTATPTQDYLSILLTEPDENGHFYTDEEIKTNILHLIHGGANTVAATLTMAIRKITEHSEVYDKLIAEHTSITEVKEEGEPLTNDDVQNMKYTWTVIEETMRLYPALPGIFREATATFEYNGYTIPKGWKLLCTAAQSFQNPEIYEEPEKFDPSRFEREGAPAHTFFPFGGGVRICPGIELAKVTMLVFLHHFLKNLQWTLADPDEKIVYHFSPGTAKGSPIRITKFKAF
ncbi:protein MpCYP716X1 [Marchantia polymorpha subsp. ruderalis]|nr:hypothetical protein MARPO_0090s0052 [Marchantia polymorpha]BBN09668.1 hypothetical protein Mp_4g21690 [Marchantia polymorpha subsp. ruderalis]|eukprot:PTQ33317.1 hypothetical protein MARPO_0090s0052 [Marchantia polymorpha]